MKRSSSLYVLLFAGVTIASFALTGSSGSEELGDYEGDAGAAAAMAPGGESDWASESKPEAPTVKPKDDMDLTSRKAAARLVARMMPEAHVSHTQFRLGSACAWTNYLDSLDYEHSFFTQEDISQFDKHRLSMSAEILLGNADFGQEVFETFKARVRDRLEFLRTVVSNEFDYTQQQLFTWRRNKLPYVANRAELDELWLNRVKNTLLAARINCELDNEESISTNTVRSVDEAVETARGEIIEIYERFLEVLDDSANDYWFGRYLDAATKAYDPHSNYMSPETAEDFNIDMQLSLQGIGAQLRTEGGAAKIVEIIPGSPSERDTSPNKLVPGDKIIGVAQEEDADYTDIRHWPLNKAVRLIRGPKGTKVRLKVIPAADPSGIKEVELIRDEIKFEDQAASCSVERLFDSLGAERTLGYVKLPSFYAGSNNSKDSAPRQVSVDLANHLAKLNEEGVEGLVLDLRGNGGGSLSEAIYVTGLFIRTGPVVMVRENRRSVVLPDNDPAIAFRKPVVVLIDRFSASASEIVAAALQDWGRAVIVGDSSSHGKGTVQTLMPLDGGRLGTLKPTTALFYRINGSATQIKGVRSDIHLPSILEAYSELGEDNLPGALAWSRIAPAQYTPVDDLKELIEQLSERSHARIATNEAWSARIKLIDNFASFNTNHVVSLCYEDRKASVKEDRRISKEAVNATIGSDFDAEADEVALETPAEETELTRAARRELRKKKNRKSDIVLDESLKILVDMIDLHGEPSLDAKPKVFDFFKSFFDVN